MIRFIEYKRHVVLGLLGYRPSSKLSMLFAVEDSNGVETRHVDKQPWPRLFERKRLHAIGLDPNVSQLFGGRRIDDADECVSFVGAPTAINDVQIFSGRIVRHGVTVVF